MIVKLQSLQLSKIFKQVEKTLLAFNQPTGNSKNMVTMFINKMKVYGASQPMISLLREILTKKFLDGIIIYIRGSQIDGVNKSFCIILIMQSETIVMLMLPVIKTKEEKKKSIDTSYASIEWSAASFFSLLVLNSAR